jgi:hypothetical protein
MDESNQQTTIHPNKTTAIPELLPIVVARLRLPSSRRREWQGSGIDKANQPVNICDQSKNHSCARYLQARSRTSYF